MLHIASLVLLALGAGADAGHVSIRPRAMALDAISFDAWLDGQSTEQLDEWIGLQPAEFARAIVEFGAEPEFGRRLTAEFEARREPFARKKYLLGILHQAWADPTKGAVTGNLSQTNMHAIYRYLIANHGLPQRAFDTRAAALAFVEMVTTKPEERARLERNVVEYAGRHHVLFTYDVWPMLAAVTWRSLTVPAWDVSTRLTYSAELAADATADIPALAERFAAGRNVRAIENDLRRQLFTRTSDVFALSLDKILQLNPSDAYEVVPPGQDLRFGDRLVYTGADGTKLHASTYLADGLVAVEDARGVRTYVTRTEDESLHFGGRHFRLTVRRPVRVAIPMFDDPAPKFYEDWLTPVHRRHGFIDYCIKRLGF